MGGQLATGSSIYMASAGVPAADGAGLSSIKSYSQLLTSIAALPLAGGTLTGNLLFTDNTYTIGAAGATRPSAVHVGAGGVVAAGDISMSKTSSQGYIRAYATDGVKNAALYHDGTHATFASSSGGVVLKPTTGVSYCYTAGVDSSLVIFNSAAANALTLTKNSVTASNDNLTLVGQYAVLAPTTGNTWCYVSGTNSIFRTYDGGLTKYSQLTHDGTNGILSTSAGNLNLVPTGGTVAVTGGITASGVVSHGAYTVATLPAAGSNAGKMAQVTDSNVAASGNYGATVAAGGANRVKVFSDGTNWVIA